MLRPEIIEGLSFADYQAIDAINMSLLKELDDSPGRLDWRRRNPWPPTDAAILGNAIHALVLEPDEFRHRYITAPLRPEELPDHFVAVPPELLGKGGAWLKAGREWRDEQEATGLVAVKPGDWGGDGLSMRSSAAKAWREWAEGQGCAVLTRAKWQQAYGAATEVLGYSPAAELLTAGSHEVTLVWQDSDMKLWCKGRMDCYDADTHTETDLKTTGLSVHHNSIGTTAYNADWHVQRAYYGMGVLAITGEPIRDHHVIAVEVDEPWRCEVYRIERDELELGQDKCRALLAKYAYYRDLGEWPLNSGEVQEMRFPGWAYK